ncbi:ankyrin repeat domain-containing protein [Candidatus Dependentiae bacterium]|nr:ankyrin repeat domain-containing protein [Candidatus Dependentiae bacterium]
MDSPTLNTQVFEKLYTHQRLTFTKSEAHALSIARQANFSEKDKEEFELVLKNKILIALGTSQAKFLFDQHCMQGKTAKEKHDYVLQLLLAACTDLNNCRKIKLDQGYAGDYGCTDKASEIKYEINKLLHWLCADINMIETLDNSSLFIYVAKSLNKKCVKLLLAQGANVNLKDRDGDTALLAICRNSGGKRIFQEEIRLKIVSLLIDAGAQINELSAEGLAPIQYVLRAASPSLIYIENNNPRFSFHHSLTTESINYIKLAALLTEKGANCDFRPSKSLEVGKPLETAYQFVCRKCEKDTYLRLEWLDLKSLMEKQQANKKWCIIQ